MASGNQSHPLLQKYFRFGAMIAVSTLVMFGLVYLNTFAFDHVFFSETSAYMALVMGASMALAMQTLAHWMALATEGRVDELFESVMARHYDPCYGRSTRRNYGEQPEALELPLTSLGPAGLMTAARQLIEVDESRPTPA